jgi:hypothetical protein
MNPKYGPTVSINKRIYAAISAIIFMKDCWFQMVEGDKKF